MPPRTRALARTENSRLTPTILQRRARGASSTPPARLGHAPPRITNSPSHSAQIEEVYDDKIEYQDTVDVEGDVDQGGNVPDSVHSLEGSKSDGLPPNPAQPLVQPLPKLLPNPGPLQVPPTATETSSMRFLSSEGRLASTVKMVRRPEFGNPIPLTVLTPRS